MGGDKLWKILCTKICIFERSNERSHFSKTKICFSKNYTIIIRKYWAAKYESRSESKFYVTCHCLSDAC